MEAILFCLQMWFIDTIHHFYLLSEHYTVALITSTLQWRSSFGYLHCVAVKCRNVLMKHTASIFRMTELFQVYVGEKRRKCLSYGQWEVIFPLELWKAVRGNKIVPANGSQYSPHFPLPKKVMGAASAHGYITHTCTQNTHACRHMLPCIEKGVISLDLKWQQALQSLQHKNIGLKY